MIYIIGGAMFQSINIKNLRAITELKINNFGQVNLFVGQNGCGKTTILEALFFLIGATNPHLLIKVNSIRGLSVLSNLLWPTYFHKMKDTKPIEIIGELFNSKECKKLTISPIKDQDLETKHITSDIIKIENGESMESDEINGLKLTCIDSENASEIIESSIFLKNGKLETPGLKKPNIQGYFIGPSMASDWRESFDKTQHKMKEKDVVSLLQEIDSKITDLRLNQVGMLQANIGLDELIPINLMGGGILKYLTVALAMLNYKDGIVLIDEIENGLHHSAQETLWQAIFSWARQLNVQVFATTHSYECINAFRNSMTDSLFESEAKLYRIERIDDNFKSIEFEPDQLARFLEKKWEMR